MSILSRIALGLTVGALVNNAVSAKPARTTPARHDPMLRYETNREIKAINDDYATRVRRYRANDASLRARYVDVIAINDERDVKIEAKRNSYKDATGLSIDSI